MLYQWWLSQGNGDYGSTGKDQSRNLARTHRCKDGRKGWMWLRTTDAPSGKITSSRGNRQKKKTKYESQRITWLPTKMLLSSAWQNRTKQRPSRGHNRPCDWLSNNKQGEMLTKASHLCHELASEQEILGCWHIRRSCCLSICGIDPMVQGVNWDRHDVAQILCKDRTWHGV